MISLLEKLAGVSALALIVSAMSSSAAETKDFSWPKADPAAISNWQAKRFGMFIHFGPVSLTGHEIGWSRGNETPIAVYDNLYKEFNPSNFNADAWVSIAKASGMKYIILTAKHHDGFCLWDTKFNEYNITRTPFKRDLLGELAAACKRQGMAFGAYYSTCDWWNTNFPLTSPGGSVKREKSDIEAYNKYLLSQIRELVTNYGPLMTIWNDVPQLFEGRGAKTIKLVRSLQPDILINDRTGDGGDYDTPEQHIGKYQNTRPWETCMTICEQWSWKPNDKMKSLGQCLRTLVVCAGGDGNLLFNVGPMPNGEIEPRQVERLKEMGVWLTKNGESIYGTRGGPWKPTKDFASTRRGNIVYLHVLHSVDEIIELPDIAAKIESMSILGGGDVKFARNDGKLILTLPLALRQENDTVVKMALAGSAMELPAMEVPPSFRATASNVFGKDEAEYGAQFAFDGDDQTRWATDYGTKQAWVAVDFPKPQTVNHVRISEDFPERVQKFEFQCRNGGDWQTIFAGTTLGADFQRTFGRVTAREFRLNILDATEGPTINEIELALK
jgi:alpha-L-fucosidase